MSSIYKLYTGAAVQEQTETYTPPVPEEAPETVPVPLSPIHLRSFLEQNRKNDMNIQELAILCIGTDRMIGDSLGPLVGSLLMQTYRSSQLYMQSDASRLGITEINIYGTLQNTVHALNLADTADVIHTKHPDSTVIAIDASLGSREQIGSVFVRSGGLQPGSGVHKKLPELGDISITGIVGEQSRHPYLTLQTVRLSAVMQMAEAICGCILQTCESMHVLCPL